VAWGTVLRPHLFSGLRLSLTLLYLVAGIALVVLVGGSSYALMRYYFDSTTDLALHHELARELRLANAAVPPDVAAAEADYSQAHDESRLLDPRVGPSLDAAPGGELAAIYTLWLDPAGGVLPHPGGAESLIAPNAEALRAAQTAGSDTRTTNIAGVPVRLLTFRVDHPGSPAFLQVGRPVSDQVEIVRAVLTGLLVLGIGCAGLLAALSWWLAGRALRPAREAWDRQQSFVANAGHELRAPLTLIRATADVALREMPTAESTDQREFWTDVLRDTDHMARLVDDLLLLSRLDAHRLNLTAGPVPLAGLLNDLVRQVQRIADERGVRVAVDAAEGIALADLERLRQVLLIVLDNALRHTPRGGEVRLSGWQSNGKAHLTVMDTGEGISPEHLVKVFERFYVVDSSHATGGTGLGLSIAHGLIAAQHGEISLTSTVGEGTRVEIVVPSA
jgi:signal transduction histidine kinase